PGLGVDYTRYNEFWPWSTFLLPYIDRNDIYTQIKFTSWPWYQDPLNGYPIRTYECPQDTRSDLVIKYHGHLIALTGYFGVSGTDQFKFEGVFGVNTMLNAEQI